MKHIFGLSIAGSDPSGGAGIQADLKVFDRLGVFGMAVPTLLTVQNRSEVSDVQTLDVAFVEKQLQCVLSDITPHAVKTGALGSSEIIDCIVSNVKQIGVPIVVDPVIKSSANEQTLVQFNSTTNFFESLLPLAAIVTPNTEEASMLADITINELSDVRLAAEKIATRGSKAVLITGGHLSTDDIVDTLYYDDTFIEFRHPRINNGPYHGTGCVLSTAIASQLAHGKSIVDAVSFGEKFIQSLLSCCQDNLLLASPVDRNLDEY